nr:peptidase M19 [Desulfuromonadales bacterium]
MDGLELHQDAIVFDGLIVSNWSRDVFEDMRRGGITAANCTCSVWEGFRDTMVNIGQWWFREHDDLILKALTTADIRAAKEQKKTAVVLGFQNTFAFEDRLEFVEIFKSAGVGVAQITYNTQNLAGSGCYESTDSGLSDFGHELVAE